MPYVLREDNPQQRKQLKAYIDDLDTSKEWLVVISPFKKARSTYQNKYYWGVIIKLIMEYSGQDADDLHEYLLGECFGWEEYKVLDKRKVRPARRSSDMDVNQFKSYNEWCRAWAADALGLVIPAPDEPMGA